VVEGGEGHLSDDGTLFVEDFEKPMPLLNLVPLHYLPYHFSRVGSRCRSVRQVDSVSVFEHAIADPRVEIKY
jgi:hypothetical protein